MNPPRSRFLSELLLSPVHHNGPRTLWRVVQPFGFYYAPLDWEIWVPEGRHTDLASIPRLPVVWWLMSDKAHAPAVIHDELCNDPATPRRLTDRVFLEAMTVAQVARWRRSLMYRAVRLHAITQRK